MRILIIGNCQVRPLTEQLKHRFAREHSVDEIIVHLAKAEEEPLHMAQMQDADLVLTQPVMDSFPVTHLRSSVVSAAHAGKMLKWPNVFFHGQCPSLCYLTVAKDRRRVSGPMGDYHLLPILEGWHARKSVRDLAEELRRGGAEDRGYDAAKSLADLSVREKDCDVIITDAIVDRWRDEALFFTFNHPRDSLLVTLADRIFERVGVTLAPFKPFRPNGRENLDLIVPPLFPVDIEEVGLRLPPRFNAVGQDMHFADGNTIRCSGRREYELEQLIEAYFQAYDYQAFELQELAVTPANLGLKERLVKQA